MSVPILYEANATDFNNLGLGPLVDTTVATVTEERNGQFILEMQYPVEGIRSSLITKNRILKVDTGHKLKDQRFVIKRINRIMGNDGLSYSIYAEHISYITADYALKPNLTVSGSGNVAMTQWLNGIIDSNRIHVDSDITTENTTSWTIDKVQNARQALGGVQGSILDVWGGEYRFDNLNISLLKHRGTVSNTLLSYGRNITDFDQEENITNTYTSIYPFAIYSVQNGDTSEQKILTIPDLVVDSVYVKNFPNRKIQVVDFSDKFSTDEKPTVERLAELAKSYIKSNNVGVPTVSTKISFVDLSKTENYKEFAPLEELDLCDEVPFAFEKFGIKTTAKISRIVWNVLLDSYDSLELGELKTNLSDVINNTNNAALDAKDAANDAKNSADNAALSANGKNRNWYGADDPAFGHLSELREGDSWYKPNGEDTELYHWINGQWVFILSTKDTHEAKDAAGAAQKEAEEAKKQANKAVDGANDAVAKAGFANNTATQAKSDAAAAGQQAKDALTSAGTAITDAQNALTNSSSAMADSTQARKDSAAAAADAVAAIAKANSTASEFGKVSQKADSAVANALNAQSDASAAVSQASSAAADSKDAKQIAGSVSQSYKTLTDGSTMTIAELESGLAAKLTKTDLDGYSTQTWTQNQIKITAEGINGTISSVKSTVDGQTTSINDLKADSSSFKSQFTTVNDTLGKQTTDIGSLQTTSKELTSGFNTLSTDNTTNKNDISQLKQTATEVSSTLETVQTQVQNSAVGTNLLTGTGHHTVTGTAVADFLSNENFDDLLTLFKGLEGQTVTVSVDYKYSGFVAGSSQNRIGWEIEIIAGSIAWHSSWYYPNNDSGSGRISSTFVVPKNITGIGEGFGYIQFSGSGTGTLSHLKLEKGSLATDWCPNPADNASVTALSKISQTVDGMKLDISKKIEQKDLNGYATETWTQGQIKITSDEINSTLSKKIEKTDLNGYATQTWTQSQIKSTADSINLSVSRIQSNLDNLAIGGRNYLADTSTQWQTQGYGITNQVSLNKWLFTFGTIKQAPFKDGEYVTVSFDYTSVGTGAYGTISPKFNDTPWGQFNGGEAMKDNGHVVRTVQWKSGWTTSGTATGIQIRMDDVATTRTVTVYNMQFERGNKDTDWKQAPEDMATVDWTKSQLDITDKKITAGITTVTNTLNNNIASATAGMATTTWTNTQIDAAKTTINLSVEQSITTSENTLNSNIANATKDMATQTWTQGQINTTADNINLSVSKVQTDLSGTRTQFAELEVKVDGIQTTVSGKANQSQVTQMAGQITSVVGDVSANSSQITQMKADINLRVKAGDVINQINISPESILIAGQKVHITGQTSIDKAVIKDAMIADIKADKITAGTLNAANVNVINLNANNITTGTIKGANLSMNLNTGEVVFQKGSIKSTNGKLNIDINDGTLSVMSSAKSGVLFNDGNMYLSTTSGGWFNPLVDKPKYGSIKYTDNFLTTHPGMTVTGSEGLLLLSGKDAYAAAVTETHIANGLGILLGPDNIYIGGDNNTAGSIMTGGKKYQGYFIDDRASVSVGDGDSSTDATINGKTIDLTFSPGSIMTENKGGLFRLSSDERSQYVLSVNTYNRTYSSGAAMTITQNGVFGRISSASKYKLAIGEISTLNDEAHQFLSVKPKQWFDKSESEALADSMTTGNTDYVDDAKALPHNGFIAEDLYTAGLDSYVIRSNDGSIESIQYDRLPVLHHELIRELFNRLDAAEMEIYKLKQEANNAS
ncbi:phage tail protein [Latilactobacillus sakei]|uniref:phage tail spike protein n=1 Tax=Latilactobacillus sakei TaxID=1599 RepID=UPI003A8575FA